MYFRRKVLPNDSRHSAIRVQVYLAFSLKVLQSVGKFLRMPVWAIKLEKQPRRSLRARRHINMNRAYNNIEFSSAELSSRQKMVFWFRPFVADI